jgi:hypothetical protein
MQGSYRVVEESMTVYTESEASRQPELERKRGHLPRLTP